MKWKSLSFYTKLLLYLQCNQKQGYEKGTKK